MKREHNTLTPSDLYLFNFPLTEDGLNHGNLPESTYIPKLRNYGSTIVTPNFNDNLVFDTTYGVLAHKHTGCSDKLVSLIDYSNFDLNKWMNDNDYELNLDFYFASYSGYQQVLEMMRCPSYASGNTSFVGYDVRWLSNEFGKLFTSGAWDPHIDLRDSGSPSYNTWVRFNVVKYNGTITIVFTNLGSDTIISSKTETVQTMFEGQPPYYITVFGFYNAGNSVNRQRYVTGATKNFYLRKI